METRKVAHGTHLVIGTRNLGQAILRNRENITVEGVILKAMLLVSELSLPFNGEDMRNRCVSTLLKKLNMVFTMTNRKVSLQSFRNVTQSVTYL